jgi:hypothetical protein
MGRGAPALLYFGRPKQCPAINPIFVIFKLGFLVVPRNPTWFNTALCLQSIHWATTGRLTTTWRTYPSSALIQSWSSS